MSAAIKKLVKQVREANNSDFDLPMTTAADFFARTGEWVTLDFLDFANEWTCCEINDGYIPELKANVKEAQIIVGDSFESIKPLGKFDLILADCPQGSFGPDNKYNEHFEFLPLMMDHLAPTSLVFFNVNLHPYVSPEHGKQRNDDYGMSSLDGWFSARDAFYNCNAEKLEMDFVHSFYKEFFGKYDFNMTNLFTELEPSNLEGHPGFILRCVASLNK